MSELFEISQLEREIHFLFRASEILDDDSKANEGIWAEIDKRNSKIKEIRGKLNLELELSENRLSQQIKMYVLRHSGSLSAISKKTGVPKTTLCGWLNGHKELTTGVLDKICQAYSITSFKVMTDTGTN